MYQIRAEQIEFVIQSDEPTHEFVLHLAVHQLIVPSYLYRDFVFDQIFAYRKAHFNFRVTCPADRYRRTQVGAYNVDERLEVAYVTCVRDKKCRNAEDRLHILHFDHYLDGSNWEKTMARLGHCGSK